MANFTFNIAKGAAAEKVRDGAANVGVLLLKTVELDAVMKTRVTVGDLLAGSTEADFTGYTRKAGITATLTVDNTTNRVRVDIPDQVWTAAGGVTNNDLFKLVVFYNEGGSDSTRIPLTAHDFRATTNGLDLTARVNAAGFYVAS